ncbi:hypothetical protein Salat_2403200 [Sesamum alatum]|uniref:Uncharacterized protein n=1 Tax=Sesamum alatum TaxID=300844 RepID=A0AAE1XXF9_9LAMI|nr:hypothetical protein Salat_2403200 [Sesamum alatum]
MPQLGKSHPRTTTRPLPFSLSVSTARKAVVEAKPIATPTIKYEIGLLLKDLMEWPSPKKESYSTRCVPFVRIANIPRTTGRRATKSWQTRPPRIESIFVEHPL